MPVEERVRRLGERVVHAIERQEWLDKPIYSFEHGFGLVLNLFGGSSQRVRNLLHGQTGDVIRGPATTAQPFRDEGS